MIPKKKQIVKTPKDYRSISLTSCLAKLNEKLIRKRLVTYLEKNYISIKQQSGFRQLRQTKDKEKDLGLFLLQMI